MNRDRQCAVVGSLQLLSIESAIEVIGFVSTPCLPITLPPPLPESDGVREDTEPTDG